MCFFKTLSFYESQMSAFLGAAQYKKVALTQKKTALHSFFIVLTLLSICCPTIHMTLQILFWPLGGAAYEK
jgi:hypothetical protein